MDNRTEIIEDKDGIVIEGERWPNWSFNFLIETMAHQDQTRCDLRDLIAAATPGDRPALEKRLQEEVERERMVYRAMGVLRIQLDRESTPQWEHYWDAVERGHHEAARRVELEAGCHAVGNSLEYMDALGAGRP